MEAGEIDFDSPIEMNGACHAGTAVPRWATASARCGGRYRDSHPDGAFRQRRGQPRWPENIAGSEEAFPRRGMNAEAQRLGMTGTLYANAHGLHSDQQFTTAPTRRCFAMGDLAADLFPRAAHFFSMEALSSGVQHHAPLQSI